MLKVKILGATNLPRPAGKDLKIKIYVQSESVVSYYYDTIKSKTKSCDPEFGETFLFNFFRSSLIKFTFYANKIFGKDILLGVATLNPSLVDASSITNRISLPISGCDLAKSLLHLEYGVFPMVYQTIPFDKIRDPFLYAYTTYNPPVLDHQYLPVEISCIHTVPSCNLFYSITPASDWSTIGQSTSSRHTQPWVCGPSGPSQVVRLSLDRSFKDRVTFFIINSKDYTGTVTIDFLVVSREASRVVLGSFSEIPSTNKSSFSLLRQYSVQVQAGCSTFVPGYFVYECSLLQKNLKIEPLPVVYQVPNEPYVFFEQRIIDAVGLHGYYRTNLLPLAGRQCLRAVMDALSVPAVNQLSIYSGGSVRVEEEDSSGNPESNTYYWKPHIYVFDKKTRARNHRLEKEIAISSPQNTGLEPYAPSPIEHLVQLNLDLYGPDVEIVFGLSCWKNMGSVTNQGFVLITESTSERLLFRNPFWFYTSLGATALFRFEQIDDLWYICPVRRNYPYLTDLEADLNNLCVNGWKTDGDMSSYEFKDVEGDFVLIEGKEKL